MYTLTVVNGSLTDENGNVLIDSHQHDYGDPVFNWADDYSACTAVFTCAGDSTHILKLDCTVTNEVQTPATCVKDGVRKYTASVEHDGKTLTDIKSLPITKTGHKWSNKFVWADDYSSCEAVFTCDNDSTHTLKLDCTVISEVQTPATCIKDGVAKYTASVEHDGKTLTDIKTPAIKKLGHQWDEQWSCDDDHHWHKCLRTNCPLSSEADMDSYAEHSYSPWVITVFASEDKDGEKQRVCSVCDHVQHGVVKYVPGNEDDEENEDEDTGSIDNTTDVENNACNADLTITKKEIVEKSV
ncbi:MAG: hypothetical protein ACI4KA_04440 [Oscillospiraceae bacterium]